MISRNKKIKKHTIHTYFSIRSIMFLQLVQYRLQSLSWQGTYCARPCTNPDRGRGCSWLGGPRCSWSVHGGALEQRAPVHSLPCCCTLTSHCCPLNEVTRVSRTPICSATAQQIHSKRSRFTVICANGSTVPYRAGCGQRTAPSFVLTTNLYNLFF